MDADLPPHLAPVPGCVPPLEHSCRWLIALDYDGTLRQESGVPVPPSFFELMQSWRSIGVRWGINTGRSMPYLLQELLPLLPFLPDFLCTCERYVHKADAAGHLLAEHSYNERCLADNLSLRASCLPAVQAALARLRQERPELVWEYAADDPLSIEAVDADTMEELLPALRHLEASLPGAAIQRAGRYLRFSDARHDKGSALAHVARAWQVPDSHLVIVGDGHNDLDAFRLFPDAFCAAPAGAHPEVVSYLKSHGGYISPNEGVEDALQQWYSQRVAPRQIDLRT